MSEIPGKFDRTNPDFGFYYKYLDKMHEHFGHPSWPPTEVPEYTEWWKSELTVYPNFHKRLDGSLPHRSWVDFIGLPQSGKSTINNTIRNLDKTGLNTPIQELNLRVLDEDDVVIVTNDEIFINMMLIFPPSIIPDEDEINFQVFSKDDPFASIQYQYYKEAFWSNKVLHEFTQGGGRHRPELILSYRGPVDATVFSYALTSHKEDPAFTIPEHYHKLTESYLIPALVGGELLTRHIDAVIVSGLPQQEAQERRRLAGKTEPGWVTDSPFYNDLSAWYGYWVKDVFPKLHDYRGTGLLVLDGEAPQDQNLERVIDYLSKVAEF